MTRLILTTTSKQLCNRQMPVYLSKEEADLLERYKEFVDDQNPHDIIDKFFKS